MRWLVLLLVVANIALLAWLSWSGQGGVRSVQEGRLPRVAEIQLVDQQGNDPARESAPAARSAPEELEEDWEAPEEDLEEDQSGDQAQTRRPAAVIEEDRTCFGIGWFEEQEDALDYLRRTEAGQPGIRFARVAEQAEPLEDFHWVMIPPLPTREDAMARYRELVGKGIEAYVVSSGEQENAISLGLFRSLRSAEDILQRRQSENIDAILVKFPRNRIRYALVFEGVADPEFFERNPALRQDEAGLQLVEFSACEGVATTEENP